MKLTYLTTTILALGLITGCSQAQTAANKVDDVAAVTVQKTSPAAEDGVNKVRALSKDGVKGKPSRPGVDVSTAPAGVYKSEATHAYITFQYLHQGYARPTLRWNEFDAVVDLNPTDPMNSSLNVTIDASSIDSGVEKFDEHLVGADFFDVANHPSITFKSTEMDQLRVGHGRVTGDLTMKGITKPVKLDVTLNKVGENFRSKKPMMGISAKTRIKRSEWGLGKYTPLVGNDVDIKIEIEFIKEE